MFDDTTKKHLWSLLLTVPSIGNMLWCLVLWLHSMSFFNKELEKYCTIKSDGVLRLQGFPEIKLFGLYISVYYTNLHFYMYHSSTVCYSQSTLWLYKQAFFFMAMVIRIFPRTNGMLTPTQQLAPTLFNHQKPPPWPSSPFELCVIGSQHC